MTNKRQKYYDYMHYTPPKQRMRSVKKQIQMSLRLNQRPINSKANITGRSRFRRRRSSRRQSRHTRSTTTPAIAERSSSTSRQAASTTSFTMKKDCVTRKTTLTTTENIWSQLASSYLF
ncbi:Hypothetical_protein [Hexamita inflata]|uniref:Hypothetical_protein n=1 Tax=Hexamita inflata TaxID=28002 RepID=A0ABP1IAR3_9EUKA